MGGKSSRDRGIQALSGAMEGVAQVLGVPVAPTDPAHRLVGMDHGSVYPVHPHTRLPQHPFRGGLG